MDQIDQWLAKQLGGSPSSVLLFVAIFVTRVLLDRWDRERAKKKARKKKAAAGG